MTYRTVERILSEADERGLRRAFMVTALSLEMDAVRAHLVEHLGSVAGRDGAIYECGVFRDPGQDWLVVVAETGAGTHPANNSVTHAHILFDNFEIQILVGVGGSRKSEAPLGTVVASDHVYMPYSGKYGPARRSARPRTFQVDSRLIGIARKVRRDRTWPNRICNPLHGTLPAVDADPMGFPPIALVAPIASVEAVLDDPESELEALIAESYSDTCVVEMEGYGAVYAASQERVPSIVVRGISDMTRGKSPKTDSEHQPAAACHAAAFAFEMLSHWAQLYSLGTFSPSVSAKAPAADTVIPDSVSSADDAPIGAPDAHVEPAVTEVKSGQRETAFVKNPEANLVLNLNEIAPKDLRGRLSTIEALLREIINSKSPTVTGAKPGSLHVFVCDPKDELRKRGVTALRAAFAERNGSDLLGMVDVSEYRRFDEWRDQLGRTSTGLMEWPDTLPDGEKIDRPELEQLTERLESSASSTTALLGLPGAGKSALLATLGKQYVENGWPVLAIKGDQLDSNIARESDLQEWLGLDALPTIILRTLAKFMPVLLILDQIDALASHLDLRTARLSILLNLVRQLGQIDNVHIALSSRTFEFQHDVRLRSVSAEALSLELPAWSRILRLLEARGVHADGWPEDVQEVMRTPQALTTYLRLQANPNSEPFTSYQAMLNELWNDRILAVDEGASRGLLATRIAETMADEESLWLATARFDDRSRDIEALEAAGLLVTREGSLGFSHQTVFDYVLSRNFARVNGSLSNYVLERQVSLFLRPKLWAGLTYLRAVNTNAYHAEFEAIWSARDLRRHLRLLLIEFLGQQTQPTDREALLMERALGLPNDRWPAYRALTGSPGWFERFGHTFIAESMSTSDDAAGHMIEVLSRAWDFASDDVLQLLQERWAPHRRHDERSWVVLQNASHWTDDSLAIACTIVKRTEIAPTVIDHVVATIGIEQPEAALHLVRARLDHELADAQAKAHALAKETAPEFESPDAWMAEFLRNSPRTPLKSLIEKGNEWETLPTLAEQAPAVFLDILWPWFEQYFDALRAITEEPHERIGYPLSSDADFGFEQEQGTDLQPSALLAGFRTAAESLARTDPHAWLAWVARLGRLDITPTQRLIAHGFAIEPEQYAKPALAFLLDDPRRYVLSSPDCLTSTSSRLVEAASNHWSDQEIVRFVTAVESYNPAVPSDLTEVQQRRFWNRDVRQIRHYLLRALPKNRLAAETRRIIEEEERVFPDDKPGTLVTVAQPIGSIMDVSAISRATDKDVVNAFCTLPDASGWDHPRHFMRGGNIQLSREFANFAKDNPTRAIRVLGLLEPETGTRAAGYALDAMSENGAPDQVLKLFHHVVQRGFDSDEFRINASRALQRLVDREVAIGANTIAILENWLANPKADEANPDTDIDPEHQGANTEPEDRESSIQRSLIWGRGGISVVPGGEFPVVKALIHIRLRREEHDHVDEVLRAYLDRCKNRVEWDHLLRSVSFLHPNNPARRADFLERLFAEVPALVGSVDAARLLVNAHWWNADFANSQLDLWRESESGLARQAYGEIVAVASLMQPKLAWAQTRLEALLETKTLDDARAGAALSAANLWTDADRHASAGSLLTSLLDGGGAGVWLATFEVFRLADELMPDSVTDSLLSMIADRLAEAPRLGATFVVERLATLLPHKAVLVSRVAKELVTAWRRNPGDVRNNAAIAAQPLVDLAVTLHRLGPETREIGTELFEQLIDINVFEARETLDEIDSRFREQPPMRRRRLARRVRARVRSQT